MNEVDTAASQTPAPKPQSLAAFNFEHRIDACIDCGRGGHTGTTLLRVILSISTGELGYACKEHAIKYLRPKDVKKK